MTMDFGSESGAGPDVEGFDVSFEGSRAERTARRTPLKPRPGYVAYWMDVYVLWNSIVFRGKVLEVKPVVLKSDLTILLATVQ